MVAVIGAGHQQFSASPHQHWRVAASAACASAAMVEKNCEDWPMNSPSAAKPWTVATAPKIAGLVETGRMIETAGNLSFRSRNGHGSGMIKLGWRSSPLGDKLKSRPPNVTLLGGENALPALSCQVWKCMVSLGPMLSRTRK